MLCKDRNGRLLPESRMEEKFLGKLYGTTAGRAALKLLVRPSVSKVGGWLLSKKISCAVIKPFIKKAGIHMEDYERRRFTSYNDFFTRKIRPESRPIDREPSHFISPCDGRLTVHTVTSEAAFYVKNTKYTLKSLTRSEKIPQRYIGGQLLIFRMTMDDYHRYAYADSGYIGKSKKIPGFFHTVKPAANDYCSVYKENQRDISLLDSENFGTLLLVEVGALLIGKIVHYEENKKVTRGAEMGRFEFGGSTIIICAEKERLKIDEDILQNSEQNIETKVQYGMKIGTKIHKIPTDAL